MSTSRAARVWAELNERQRLYLSTIFDFDQVAEAEIKACSARWEKTPPASEWRQVTYDIKVPKHAQLGAGYTSVQHTLRRAGQHDPGSGATLAALRKRGLITVTYDHVEVPPFGWVPRIRVRLTTLGRMAARVGTGITAPTSPPRGLMARWSFNALARLYVAGRTGRTLDVTAERADQAPSWNTLLNLRDRKDGSLIEEFTVRSRYPGINPHTGYEYAERVDHRVRLSARGARHYALHHACYRELYPDIDAPAPAERVEGAHRELADHRTRRPRHLVRDTDLPVLTWLTALEAKGACPLRQRVAEEYERLHRRVPDEVRAIPPGLLRWQVSDLTRTEKSIDRLLAHPGGPLIEVIQAPNGPCHRPTHPSVALIVLTHLGRDHYTRYLEEYRRTYPELFPPTTAPAP